MYYFSSVDNDIDNPLIYAFVSRRDVYHVRKYLLSMFTVCDTTVFTAVNELSPENIGGKIILVTSDYPEEMAFFQDQYTLLVPKNPDERVSYTERHFPTSSYYRYGVVPLSHDGKPSVLLCQLSTDASIPALSFGDRFMLEADMIPTYTGKPTITTVGKFYLNELILHRSCGLLFPYHNKPFVPDQLDKMIADAMLEGKIGRPEYDIYMDNGHFFGQASDISVATWSDRSITTSPEVKKRREELIAQYRDQLSDPIIANKIENELIALDKEYLKGDSSEPFYAVTKGKTFNEQRKKMYLIVGTMVAFTKETGNYEHIAQPLSEGWDIKKFPSIANDIRRGSYGRGKKTAEGGVQTKNILRILQDVRITEDDCGTKSGTEIVLTEENFKLYTGRYLLKENRVLSVELAKTLFGKPITIRTPMKCRCQTGFCLRCCGVLFQATKNRNIGMNAVVVPSRFTSISMKSMHVSGITTYSIDNVSRFFVGE